MARLTAAQRNKIPRSDYGLPGGTKASGGKPSYPMEDKSHAANAKARATQAVKTGRMSTSTEKKIDAKANGVLGKAGSKKAGEGSAADKRQDAAMRKRTGMTQKQVEASPADRKADAGRARTRTPARASDHLEMAARHRALSDTHREAADKHVDMAVKAAAKAVGGMKPGSQDGLAMNVNYGGMSTDGLGAAVRSVTQGSPSPIVAMARTRSRK